MNTFRGRLSAPFRKLSEVIGAPQRLVRTTTSRPTALSRTRDVGVSDYSYWDRVRNGRVQGMELSGLLLKPLHSKIAAWSMGKAPTFAVEGSKRTAEYLNEWWKNNHGHILAAYEDAVALGDNYLVVNGDLTVQAVPPHVVEPIVDEQDYSRFIGWRIRDTYPHPTAPARSMHIEDAFYRDGRIRTITFAGGGIGAGSTQIYSTFGVLPVIHLANNKGPDEMFGKPEAYALPAMLQRYNETLVAALDGNKRQGRPTPVVEKMGSRAEVDAFWADHSESQTELQPDGTQVTRQVVEFDPDRLMTLAGDAQFNWKSPAAFANDTQILLGLLFYLWLQHAEMPEWSMGNAIASSQASANTQVEPLVKFIEKKRGEIEHWMRQLINVVLTFASISEPGVRADLDIEIRWEPMTTEDGQLILQSLTWAWDKGLIDNLTAVSKLPVDLDDPQKVLDRAQREFEERQQDYEDAADQRLEQAAQRAAEREPAEPDDDEELPVMAQAGSSAAR